MKSISVEKISAAAGTVLSSKQSCSVAVTEVLPPELATADSLVFISKAEQAELVKEKKVKAVVVLEKIFSEVRLPGDIQIWITANIQQAMTKILPLFDKNAPFYHVGVHPTAVVHPTAEVHPRAHIGALSFVGAHAKIGEDTVIWPHAYVGPFCEIGSRCHISSHTTIGCDGFGFYTDKNFNHHKVPQIGKVVIEDDCEFGSHCAVDRATLTETRIKRGSKFDNFCHIAHNVEIGENALVAAGFMVAGSARLGKNLMTSGGVHILGHLKVSDNVVLTARAGVTKTIDEPGMYGGFPLETHKESTKTLVSLTQVKKLKKQVNKILNHLNLKDEEE
jgi:UDP-3-O-[3-hydroxymyristoyl] glucosamine N-acyltransferase